jgi:hypothetical protein
MIIGFHGAAGAGKDTAASFLMGRPHNFIRLAFADKLKIGCKAIFGLTDSQVFGQDKDKIDRYWNLTPREILQRVGTECFRNTFDSDIWVKAALREVDAKWYDYVITDVRFPNEATAIKALGGRVFCISRANAPGLSMAHVSESALRDWPFDGVIENNGSLEDLRVAVLKQTFT